ncbi:MAG TPA: D-alanyl-D-alanine endopeptidase [Noviherbaspirillum sp.]|nr:D-alanyl-D-alanine endopeptidase [Noviherbaspirillum sp.]
MVRYALAILISVLHIFFAASEAWAKDAAKTSASVRKQVTKKRATATHGAARGSIAKKARAASARGAKAARTRKAAPRKASVHRKRKVAHASLRKARASRPQPKLAEADGPLDLRANNVLVWDASSAEVLYEKNADAVQPIASISKLMTALVVVEAQQDMDEVIEVTADDIDRLKHTSSRLRVGSRLSRADMLHIALMSSENRAASALGRNYPGGLKAFVAAMNARARSLGMHDTHYVEPTGLSSQNVSSARDLAKLVMAAQQYPLIREYSTYHEYDVDPGGPSLHYRNSNRLISNPDWDIVVQKTGYISEAGRCLVMQTRIQGRPIVMVFLDAKGKFSRAADAGRVRRWLESVNVAQM